MRYKSILIAVMIFYSFIIGQAELCNARPPEIPFGAGINPLSEPKVNHAIAFEYYITAEYDFDTVAITVMTIGGINYEGDKNWEVVSNNGDSLAFTFNAIIPPNDTCGIIVKSVVKRNNMPLMDAHIYFITTESTVETLKIDPRFQTYPFNKLHGRSENQYRGKELPWEPSWPKPEYKVIYHALTDREMMKKLEREPLTDSDVQHINVDGEIWGRSKGEFKFHKIGLIKDQAAYHDSIQNELYENTTHIKYEVILNLYKPEDSFWGRSTPTDRGGWFVSCGAGIVN